MKNLFTLLMIAMVAIFTAKGQADIETGLVGYYKFDEGDGTVTLNSTLGAPDGTLENDPLWVEGKFGNALEFTNSATGHVSLETFDPTLGGDELTISAWIYWTGVGTGGWHGVCGKRNGWADVPFMFDIATIENNGILQFEVNDAGVKHVVESATVPTENDWMHMVLAFDGDTAIFYLNGVFDSKGAMVFGEGREAAFTIGCGEMGGAHAFSGKIDEFRFYSRVLSEEDVAELYTYDPTQIGIKNVIHTNGLLENYPNPFNSQTILKYDINKPGLVEISLYDCTGKQVKSLVNQYISTTSNRIAIDGSGLTEGFYFCELKVDSEVISTRKISLVK